MTRADASTYLTQMTSALATEAALTSGQITSAQNQATDNSLRQLGFTEAQLPTAVTDDSLVLPYQALLLYYLLKQFLFLFTIRVDVNIAGSIQASRSQLVKQVKMLLDAALTECNGYGYFVGGDNFQMGRVTLDYLEPTGSEF